MSAYQTEEEQVEAIKKWWKENGKSVIGGVVLGFAIIGGWQGWKFYERNQGETASAYFDVMMQAGNAGNVDAALEHGKRLVGDYAGTAYASFAGMEMAKLSYQKGEKAAAREHLQWVADHGSDPAIKEVARLRLGRLLLDMGDHDALQSVLNATPLPAFAGEFAVLRGDLDAARGDRDAARGAYQEALEKGVADETLLRMKLVDVGGQVPTS
ncbi:YfgM family protein [Thiosocius teredinicola]|uniref:YfgM family protein n=1 Tax=Thiosocius teredinicola TaxID=1973002 RepID=UPI000990BC48